MIKITSKDNCCGCTACYSVCPHQCIQMNEDNEGFTYPLVDKRECIDCHLCNNVCPYNFVKKQEEFKTIFMAVQYKVKDKRYSSTAGGAFSLIADYLIDQGAIVYGVGYDDKMIVCHKEVVSKESIEGLRGSKYVQSTLRDTMKKIKISLDKGSTILFVGTPCQVYGLKNYVGYHAKLYTMDLLCLGVSSPKLFNEWVLYLNNKYQEQVINIQFRNKNYGYSSPNVRVHFNNGKVIDQCYDTKVHSQLFFKYLNVRPSCYECLYREIPRVSDFTIGDFTEIREYISEFDDDIGTTKMWIHTEKGKMLFERVEEKANFHIIKSNESNIIGGPKKQIKKPELRNKFFEDAITLEYYELISKWEPNSVKKEILNVLRRFINKLSFRSYIFKIIRLQDAKKHNQMVKDLNSNKD